jgi:hypothetical protein
MLVYSSEKKSILFFFFLYFFFEVCIGGSGGLLKYDLITLRKINFTIAMGIMIFLVALRKRLDYEATRITFIFLMLLFIDTLLGLYNYGAGFGQIYENLFAESFFLLLPFYPLFVTNKHHVEIISKVIVSAAILLAVSQVLVVILILTGVLNFLSVYNFLSQADNEFFGRGNFSFLYKGFIYACIGFYFLHIIKNSVVKRLLQIVILIGLVLTFVRGFVLALFATGMIFNFFFKSKVLSFLIIFAGIIIVILFSSSFEKLSFNRDESDRIRKVEVQQVAEAITPVSFFIGHGLGKGVAIRQNHMEINYLEIFHKQGVIGLVFWFYIFVYIIINYINVRKLNPANENLARPFLLATIFIYIESITNPFLTNSIGMNIIMISIVCLNVLKKKELTENTGFTNLQLQ